MLDKPLHGPIFRSCEPMSLAVETIHELVAPVVMISANGLVCLALYNRLANVVSRLRVFHKERFETHERLVGQCVDEGTPHETDHKILRLESLERQCTLNHKRARLLRTALALMLLGIMAMLICSLTLGVAQVWPQLSSVGLLPFTFGVLCMLGGIGCALWELLSSMDPLKLEGEYLDEVAAQHPLKLTTSTTRIARTSAFRPKGKTFLSKSLPDNDA